MYVHTSRRGGKKREEGPDAETLQMILTVHRNARIVSYIWQWVLGTYTDSGTEQGIRMESISSSR